MENIFKFYNGILEVTARSTKNTSAQSRDSLIQFVDLFTKLFNSFDDSLDLELFFKEHKKTILEKKLKRLMALWSSADAEFNIVYGSLIMFADDLSFIKSSNPECFAKFKRNLIKQRSSNSWDGFRFEVRVYASLIKKGIQIKNQESPDFIVLHDGESVFIESTICRVEQQKSKSHLYKISSSINKKNQKTYSNANTALFVDASNILYHNSQVDGLDHDRLFEDLINSVANDKAVRFGAIVIFCFVINREKSYYESLYRRVLFEHCSENLKKLIDQEYPDGFDYVVDPEISMSC